MAIPLLDLLSTIACAVPRLVARRAPRLERRRLGLAAATCLIAGLGFGGCAQSPQQISATSHSREYFPSTVYGSASRRVIADGQPIPHGGGQYLVGKPYTVAGRTYYPNESRKTQIGSASWYGDAFHGRLTANGEIYDRDGFTAASPTMPIPSYVRVTNLRNNYSMIVRVNDRGPYASNRIMDVSRRVAEALDFKRIGTTTLKVEYVARASLAGSDDAKLFATLRTDGPASFRSAPTMMAEAPTPPPARVASIAPYAPEPDTLPTGSYRPLPARRSRVASVEPARDEPRPLHGARAQPMPPSRPMDLGTIPGAATPIRAHRDTAQQHRDMLQLRMARARDD